MNPNQMMIAKAMVAQTALRDVARESRRRRSRTEAAAVAHRLALTDPA